MGYQIEGRVGKETSQLVQREVDKPEQELEQRLHAKNRRKLGEVKREETGKIAW